MHPADDDRRPGEDWSLVSLYELVPDAYELDLLEEARRPPVASMGHDSGDAVPEPEGAVPSPTQACFLVQRVLGGVVVDDSAR